MEDIYVNSFNFHLFISILNFLLGIMSLTLIVTAIVQALWKTKWFKYYMVADKRWIQKTVLELIRENQERDKLFLQDVTMEIYKFIKSMEHPHKFCNLNIKQEIMEDMSFNTEQEMIKISEEVISIANKFCKDKTKIKNRYMCDKTMQTDVKSEIFICSTCSNGKKMFLGKRKYPNYLDKYVKNSMNHYLNDIRNKMKILTLSIESDVVKPCKDLLNQMNKLSVCMTSVLENVFETIPVGYEKMIQKLLQIHDQTAQKIIYSFETNKECLYHLHQSQNKLTTTNKNNTKKLLVHTDEVIIKDFTKEHNNDIPEKNINLENKLNPEKNLNSEKDPIIDTNYMKSFKELMQQMIVLSFSITNILEKVFDKMPPSCEKMMQKFSQMHEDTVLKALEPLKLNKDFLYCLYGNHEKLLNSTQDKTEKLMRCSNDEILKNFVIMKKQNIELMKLTLMIAQKLNIIEHYNVSGQTDEDDDDTISNSPLYYWKSKNDTSSESSSSLRTNQLII